MPGKTKTDKNIIKRGENTWLLRYELPRDSITGKRRQKAETFKGSSKQAEKRLREINFQLDKGDFIEPSKMLFSDYIETWMVIHRPNVSKKTFERYEGIIRNHLNPALGHLPMQKITPLIVQRFLAEKSDGGRADKKTGGLKKGSVRYLYIVLNLVLRSAAENELIRSNPMVKVKAPALDDTDITPLTSEQTYQFLQAAKGNRFEVLFKLAIASGMRRSELFAIIWKDIDWDNNMVKINRALHVSKGGMEFGPPKTKNSKRTIPLPSDAVEALYSHRIRQNEHKIKMGSLYEDNDLVFPAENGKPFCPDNIDRYFKPVLDKAGLPVISFHSLRHTHATLLIKDCKDAKMVSKRLGHYDVAFTMRVYYHFLPEDEKEAMYSFNRILTGEYNNRTGDSSDSVKESLLSSGEQNVNNYLNHTACN